MIVSRVNDAPLLSWSGDGGSVYVELDCVPSFSYTRQGQITDFAVEGGSSIAEHRVRKPTAITLEVVQTPTPIDAAVNGKFDAYMKLETVELKAPKNNTPNRSLYLLALGALGAGVGAAADALGIGGLGPAPWRASVLTATSDEDRINALLDDLDKAYDAAAVFKLQWLGKEWTDFALESFSYSRQAGRLAGNFSISLKKVNIVTTATALAIQAPAELGLKLPIDLGKKPGVGFDDVEAQIMKDSLLETTPGLGDFL
jgi:hypothetical protein